LNNAGAALVVRAEVRCGKSAALRTASTCAISERRIVEQGSLVSRAAEHSGSSSGQGWRGLPVHWRSAHRGAVRRQSKTTGAGVSRRRGACGENPNTSSGLRACACLVHTRKHEEQVTSSAVPSSVAWRGVGRKSNAIAQPFVRADVPRSTVARRSTQTLGQCAITVVAHRLFAFSRRSLFAPSSVLALGRAARPLAGSEPLVVRVQMLHAARVTRLALSLCAKYFKACTDVSRRFGQQAALAFLNFVRPTLPSSGQPRGTGFAAQGQR
jgi:hypothetical protein